jgi:hypothetical protein
MKERQDVASGKHRTRTSARRNAVFREVNGSGRSASRLPPPKFKTLAGGRRRGLRFSPTNESMSFPPAHLSLVVDEVGSGAHGLTSPQAVADQAQTADTGD